jgi:hypothetical protein
MSQSTHEEIMAMRHSDPEVNKVFQDFEVEATNVLVDILKANGFNTKDIYEKCHIIIGWIDNLCHELAYHKHQELNYKRMTDMVVNSIIHLLS